MWELDLIVSYKNRKYLHYIKENIVKSEYYNNKGIFALIRKNNNVILSIAIIDISNELIDKIADWISESLVFSEKENFITKKKLPDSSNFRSTFLKALALINVTDDIKFVKERLDMNSKTINFHSFFSFCLSDLKNRWEKELLMYFPKDSTISDDSLLDILYSIVKSNETKIEIIIDYLDNKYILSGGDDLTIPANDEADILANLVILSPNKITINCKNKLTKDTFVLLNYLFKDKLF